MFRWLENVVNECETPESNSLSVSWPAYHTTQSEKKECDSGRAIGCLLPLFHDVAHSEAMIFHAMNVIRSAVHHVNPLQAPIIAMDQPLYALAKKIQWAMKPSHGEDKFVIMFGGLHIEMAALKLIGDLLAGSGWTAAIAEAGIATAGTADSFLKANHVTKTRHAHQVNTSSLYLLLHKAYQDSQTCQTRDMLPMSLDDWCCDRSNESRQFKFWYQVLLLTIDVLLFNRSIREANFMLYIDTLKTSHLGFCS